MNITSAQYMKGSLVNDNQSITAIVDGIKMSVPLDPANRHYAAILEWAKEDGNEIQAAE
jgi:hypothetical protein